MKSIIKLSFLILLFAGCAKIPLQSVALANALQIEGERMHKLNTMLINRVFSSKKITIDKFIKDEYEPEMIKNFISLLPDTIDFKENFTELMQAITPKISARRDSLLNALEIQRENIIEKLDLDYKVFDNAATELQNLLKSAVKIDMEKQALFDKAKEITKNKIDFNKVENALDKFINSAGNVSSNILVFNEDINQILNQ